MTPEQQMARFRQSEDEAFVAHMNREFTRDLFGQPEEFPWPLGLSQRLRKRAESRRKERRWVLKRRRLPTLADLAAEISPKTARIVKLLSLQNQMMEDLFWRDLEDESATPLATSPPVTFRFG